MTQTFGLLIMSYQNKIKAAFYRLLLLYKKFPKIFDIKSLVNPLTPVMFLNKPRISSSFLSISYI